MEPYQRKVKDLHDVRGEIEALKAEGKRVVFTNGCFDILHAGHTRYLSAASSLGDYLIVAVNSDRSVKSLKGKERPVVNEKERAEVLAALGFVDAVVIFDEPDPLRIITTLMPHVLVKGGDWDVEDIIGADVVKKAGGEVHRIPYEVGLSTSVLIEKLRKPPNIDRHK
jgi:D-beta-D-heptose 7-phosphate kinase/D-beta-D-heptose 1-phosphate adenosyltransferase